MLNMNDVIGSSTQTPNQREVKVSNQKDPRRWVTLSTTVTFQREGHRAPSPPPILRQVPGECSSLARTRDSPGHQLPQTALTPTFLPCCQFPAILWRPQVPAGPSLNMVVSRHARETPGEGRPTRVTHGVNQIILSFQSRHGGHTSYSSTQELETGRSGV